VFGHHDYGGAARATAEAARRKPGSLLVRRAKLVLPLLAVPLAVGLLLAGLSRGGGAPPSSATKKD
jgi:hypothetical protein